MRTNRQKMNTDVAGNTSKKADICETLKILSRAQRLLSVNVGLNAQHPLFSSFLYGFDSYDFLKE